MTDMHRRTEPIAEVPSPQPVGTDDRTIDVTVVINFS
jgi:hypothetical protein